MAGLEIVDMPRDGLLFAFHLPVSDTGVVWIDVKPDSFNVFAKFLVTED
jgi:hypothetical protein